MGTNNPDAWKMLRIPAWLHQAIGAEAKRHKVLLWQEVAARFPKATMSAPTASPKPTQVKPNPKAKSLHPTVARPKQPKCCPDCWFASEPSLGHLSYCPAK